MALYQTNSSILRAGLFSNVIFSVSCAVILLFQNNWLGEKLFIHEHFWFDLEVRSWLFYLGLGLAGFAALVLFRGTQSILSKRAIRSIIIGDILWVVISLVALLSGGVYLETAGFWVIIAVALMILFFVMVQSFGLKILYQGKSKLDIKNRDGSILLEAKRVLNASPAVAWKIMTEHEAYADVADNLAKVEVLQGDGLGMSRQCTSIKGEVWTEQANVWEPGKQFGFSVNTKEMSYPYPLDKLSGLWSVKTLANNQCEITMAFNVTPLANAKGRMFAFLMCNLFAPGVDRLLGRWAEKMEAS